MGCKRHGGISDHVGSLSRGAEVVNVETGAVPRGDASKFRLTFASSLIRRRVDMCMSCSDDLAQPMETAARRQHYSCTMIHG